MTSRGRSRPMRRGSCSRTIRIVTTCSRGSTAGWSSATSSARAVYGTALLVLLAGATLMLGRFDRVRLHHLAQALIPIAARVFLAVGHDTVAAASMCRSAGRPMCASRSFGNAWSAWLAWKVTGVMRAGRAACGVRVVRRRACRHRQRVVVDVLGFLKRIACRASAVTQRRGNEPGRHASRIGVKQRHVEGSCRFFLPARTKSGLALLQRLLECVCTKGSRSRVQVTLATAQHLSGGGPHNTLSYFVRISLPSRVRATDRSLRYARC